MDLSIIIPSYNTKDLLVRCLDSIFQSLQNVHFSYEVIVVDNASKDGSRDILNNKYTQVIKIFNNNNAGYGKANNQGIKRAKGTYILLLNSDIQVLGHGIGVLYQFIGEHPKSFAGGKLFNEDGSPQPSCGPMYTLPVVAMMLFGQGDKFGISRYSPLAARQVDWVTGACLIGAKQSFVDVGLFDESIFMYMEEIDLLYRAGKKRYRIFFQPEARFIHSGAASSSKRRTPVVNIYRGLTYFYRKHRGPLAVAAVKLMLLTKALAAIVLGRMIGKQDLTLTYEEALRVV